MQMSNGESKTLRGLSTVSFFAEDMAAARDWYTALLGIPPYFQRPNRDGNTPAYVEFRIGDFQHELGIISSRYAPKRADGAGGPRGVIVYWHVDDVAATLEKLLSMGATEYEPLTPRGVGFTTASVIDPFGNILGIMYNQHYMEMVKPSHAE